MDVAVDVTSRHGHGQGGDQQQRRRLGRPNGRTDRVNREQMIGAKPVLPFFLFCLPNHRFC